MTKRSWNVKRSENIERLKTLLVKLGNEKAELEAIQRDPLNIVRDKCESIRNEIDLCTDEFINRLHDYRAKMLRKLDDYETKIVKEVSTFSVNFSLSFKVIII